MRFETKNKNWNAVKDDIRNFLFEKNIKGHNFKLVKENELMHITDAFILGERSHSEVIMCSHCGEKQELNIKKDVFSVTNECNTKDFKVVTEINVSSGKLLFANYCFDVTDTFDYSKNIFSYVFKKRVAVTEMLAEQNIYYSTIYQIHPDFYKISDKEIHLISSAYDENDEELSYHSYEKLAHMKTETSTVLIMDKEVCKEVLKSLNVKADRIFDFKTIEVPKGRYRITNYTMTPEFNDSDYRNLQLALKIEKID